MEYSKNIAFRIANLRAKNFRFPKIFSILVFNPQCGTLTLFVFYGNGIFESPSRLELISKMDISIHYHSGFTGHLIRKAIDIAAITMSHHFDEKNINIVNFDLIINYYLNKLIE